MNPEKKEILEPTPVEEDDLKRADAEADLLERSLQNERLRFGIYVARTALGVFIAASVAFVIILAVVVYHMIAPEDRRWLSISNIQTLTLVLATGSFVTNLIAPAMRYIRGDRDEYGL